jgi:hypothetical protein
VAIKNSQQKLVAMSQPSSSSSSVFTQVFEEPHGRAMLCVEADRYTITFEGDSTPYQLAKTSFEYRLQGKLPAASGVLLDLTLYAGSIDWTYLRSLPGTPGWENPDKIACLVADSALAWIGKMLNAIIPQVSCRLFTDRESAITWLGWT